MSERLRVLSYTCSVPQSAPAHAGNAFGCAAAQAYSEAYAEATAEAHSKAAAKALASCECVADAKAIAFGKANTYLELVAQANSLVKAKSCAKSAPRPLVPRPAEAYSTARPARRRLCGVRWCHIPDIAFSSCSTDMLCRNSHRRLSTWCLPVARGASRSSPVLTSRAPLRPRPGVLEACLRPILRACI